jgi:hypothetical protein
MKERTNPETWSIISLITDAGMELSKPNPSNNEITKQTRAVPCIRTEVKALQIIVASDLGQYEIAHDHCASRESLLKRIA